MVYVHLWDFYGITKLRLKWQLNRIYSYQQILKIESISFQRKLDLSSIMRIDEIQSISSQTVEDASKEAVMIKSDQKMNFNDTSYN